MYVSEYNILDSVLDMECGNPKETEWVLGILTNAKKQLEVTNKQHFLQFRLNL